MTRSKVKKKSVPRWVKPAHTELKGLDLLRALQREAEELAKGIGPQQWWFTVTEAARYLRVSSTTIRNLIHDGRLKAVPDGIGHGYRLDRTDLDQFFRRSKEIIPPYRRGTHPWVAKRHAANRKKVTR